jgi:LAS superfamily LD-carboxypeptidase LdcB
MKPIIIALILLSFACKNPNSSEILTFSKFNIPQKETTYSKDFLLGKFEPSNDTNFVLIPEKYCLYGNQYILREAYNKFAEMYSAAANEGIYLNIVSAHRTYFTQKWLWETKWNEHRNHFSNDMECVAYLLNFLAIPGTSRHHWGTEIDILSVSPQYFTYGSGEKAYNWLKDNAHQYGYYQAYTPNRETGYNAEPWHWSYAALSIPILSDYANTIAESDLGSFSGSNTISELNIISNYVLGINTKLLPKN